MQDMVSARAATANPVTLNAGNRSIDELLQVVAAASRSQTRIRLTGVKAKPIEDLMRIVVTGGDCVVLEPEAERTAPEKRRRWRFGF